MKQRWFVALIAAVGLLTLACGGAAGSRGWAPPTLIGDLLLVSAHKGELDAINSQGEQQWNFPNHWNLSGAKEPSGIYGAPVASSDNSLVYVGDYNGYVFAFRPGEFRSGSSDKPKAGWLKLDGPVLGGLALDSASDTLFVTAGKAVYSIKASDLTARIGNNKADVRSTKLFETGGQIWSAPVMTGGKMLISSLDGYLYAIDPVTGSEAWRFSAGGALASTPVIAGNLALVGGFDRRMHAVEVATGNESWSVQASNWVWNQPKVEGSVAYCGDFDGKLYAASLSDGSLLWSMDLAKGQIRGSPALAGGVLVVGSYSGWLVGINPAAQSVRWEKQLDAALNADLVEAGSKLLIAPARCVSPPGSSEPVYYTSVDPQTGELQSARGVC